MVQEFDQEVRFRIHILPENILLFRDDESYMFWDYDTGEIFYEMPVGDHYSIDPVGRGVWVAEINENEVDHYIFTLHDYQAGQIIRQLDVESFLLGYFRFSADGAKIILHPRSTRTDEPIVVDSVSGELIGPYMPEEESSSYPERIIGQVGNLVITRTDDVYQIWDSQSGHYLTELSLEYDFSSIQVSPNGYFIAVVGEDGIIRILGVPVEGE